MYDMHDHIGGHTASYEFPGGWTFDEGPHVSFTDNIRIQDLLAANVGGKYEQCATRINNYWRGHWIKHPAQINLHGLPADLVTKILLEFVEVAQRTESQPIRNYEDWLRASFGSTFSETFPMEYTIKYHTTTAANLSTEWIGPRLYRPKLEEVFRGALQAKSDDVHYISGFRYPSRGGFVAYLGPFRRIADIKLGHKVEGGVGPDRDEEGREVCDVGRRQRLPVPAEVTVVALGFEVLDDLLGDLGQDRVAVARIDERLLQLDLEIEGFRLQARGPSGQRHLQGDDDRQPAQQVRHGLSSGRS